MCLYRLVCASLQFALKTAIIVACLASFPSLFKKSKHAKHQRLPEGNPEGGSDATSGRALFFSRKSKASKESKSNIVLNRIGLQQASNIMDGSRFLSTPWNRHQKPSFDSSEHILPLNEVHIRV